MPKEVYFPPVHPVWEFERDSVRFYAIVNARTVVCRVSGEALMQHFGAKTLDASDAVRAFEQHRQAIEAVARRKIDHEVEARGSVPEVILTTADFQRAGSDTAKVASTGFLTVTPPDVLEDPGLSGMVKTIDSILPENFPRGKSSVTIEYSKIPVPNRPALLGVKLTESDSGATVESIFTQEDLQKEHFARFSLFRLWDDLLRGKARRLAQSSQSSPAGE